MQLIRYAANHESSLYKIITYPDDQHTIRLNLQELDVKKEVHIQCRIKNWKNLEILMCLIAALRHHDFIVSRLTFIYLFGLRSDRAFHSGEPNYMRDVLGHVIKSLKIPHINILQAHNYISARYCGAYSSHKTLEYLISTLPKDTILIGGDKSIEWRSEFSSDTPAIKFSKVRDESEIQIKLDADDIAYLIPHVKDHPIAIYDDLCDGGATFIAEAQYLRDVLGLKNPIYLVVMHGLFSKGFDKLFNYFERIYTTNSFQNFPQNPDDPLHIPIDKLIVTKVI